MHIVFSTKNRVDLITPEIEDNLYAYIHGIAENNGAKLIIGGGTANHIHLLVSLPKKIDVPLLIGDIKRDSSGWVKEQSTKYADFYWQKGYGAFSIGQKLFVAFSDGLCNSITQRFSLGYNVCRFQRRKKAI